MGQHQRSPQELELALKHVRSFQAQPQRYCQELMLQALARCYDLVLQCEFNWRSALEDDGSKLRRWGWRRRILKTPVGPVTIKIPRCRSGPITQLVPNYARRAPDFEHDALELCATSLDAASAPKFKQRLWALFSPAYRPQDFTVLDLLEAEVRAALEQQFCCELPPRLAVVGYSRWDYDPTRDLLTLSTGKPCPYIIELCCGITPQERFELLELKLLRHRHHEDEPQQWAQAQCAQLKRLQARGVRDVLVLLGPGLALDYDQAHQYFEWLTLAAAPQVSR